MKNTIILLISIATFIACAKQKAEQVSTIDSTLQVSVDSILQNKLSELNATVGPVLSSDNMTTDSLNMELTATKDTARKSLNDIRFEGWKEQDWLDNEYIRALRKYIDAYNKGEIEDSSLNPYRENIKSKFVVYNIEPFLLGGLFISIVFLDMPEIVFDSWVYSNVNEIEETVTGYEVHGLRTNKEESAFTKENIIQIIEEHPEIKLW